MKKVLIVDDSATMRKYLRRALQEAEVAFDEIVEAEHGIEGLRRLVEGGVTVVLCDVSMPEMTGPEFVRTVRKRLDADALPIFMVTTERECEARTATPGANGVLPKPVSVELLREALVPVLGERPAEDAA